MALSPNSWHCIRLSARRSFGQRVRPSCHFGTASLATKVIATWTGASVGRSVEECLGNLFDQAWSWTTVMSRPEDVLWRAGGQTVHMHHITHGKSRQEYIRPLQMFFRFFVGGGIRRDSRQLVLRSSDSAKRWEPKISTCCEHAKIFRTSPMHINSPWWIPGCPLILITNQLTRYSWFQ